ncbi:MAG: DUF2254 domain-containing protein [Verrucomicrobiales bacterium]|nr:DUF2254 domain-containing protein [Verrucomicrobiales bacterium]
MPIRLLNFLRGVYFRTISSIGFWPTLISGLLAAAAILLLSSNTDKPTAFLLEKLPGLMIKDGDTARVLLSTIVAGMVSLTVFSFTMVMSQLNRAASEYSPRLLPGLISTRRHQVVLGLFLGTITFCLFVLINIEPSDDKYTLPGLAVLIGVILALSSLGVFIYFLHSISRSIQVTHILRTVATKTEKRLNQLSNSEARQGSAVPHREIGEVELVAERSGFLCGCNEKSLLAIADEHDLHIEVIAIQGEIILEKSIPVRINREVEEEIRKEILSCLYLDDEERVESNYILGFKQIAEVGIRAMSPGTNDPGTALIAIDHLTRLLTFRMKFDDREDYQSDGRKGSVAIAVVTFPTLLYYLHAPFRTYCKHDVIIVLKLLQMLSHLLSQPQGIEEHTEAICREINSLLDDCRQEIKSPADLERIDQSAKEALAKK